MRVLVVGTGSIGKRHIHNLMNLGIEVVAYRYRGSKETADNPLPQGVFVIGKLEEAMSAYFDAVVVANRTDLHMPVAIASAKAGFHLFIEKPLSDSLRDVDELSHLVDTNKLVVEIGFMLRFHPNLRWIKSFLAEGNLGELHYARAIVGQYLPDWRPDSDYRQSYSAHRAWGGGVIFDLIHELDVVRWLLGEPVEVVTMTQYSPWLDIETEAVAQIGLRLQSGILAQIHMDYLRPSYARMLEIAGTRGVLAWDYPSGTVSLTGADGINRIVNKVPDDFERNDMYRAHMQHFLHRLADREMEPGASLDDGIKALSLALSCHISAREGRSIHPQDIGKTI